MDRLLDLVREDFDRRREEDRAQRETIILGGGGLPPCLPETVLEALISDTLPPSEVDAAQTHLAECLRCVHAYANIRCLLELASPVSITEEVPSRTRDRRAWGRAIELCQNVLVRPIPAGWAVGGAMAVLALTWMIASYPASVGLRVSPGSRVPSGMIGLAHRPDATTATITGVVEAIRDATSHGVEAHIV